MAAKKQHTSDSNEIEEGDEKLESTRNDGLTPYVSSVGTVDELLARWEEQLQTDREGFSHHIDNPMTLVGAKYDVLRLHVGELRAALGK